MREIKQMSDIPIGSNVKIIVDISGKKGEIIGCVTKQFPNDNKNGNGIGIKAIYYKNKKINFKDYKVIIRYTVPKGRTYDFPITFINIDYNNDIISFFTRQVPIPLNYKRASRYNCGYDTCIKIDGLNDEFNGYCKDISYVGAAFVCKDDKGKFRHGQHICGSVTFKNLKFENLNGQVVRIEDNYLGGTSIIAVNFDEINESIKKLVDMLKKQEIERKNRRIGA